MGRDSLLGKILIWGGIAFLVFYVAFRPEESAEVFGDIGEAILEVPKAFARFFGSLVA